MMDEYGGSGGSNSDGGDLIEIDLNFESMRRFQAEFSPNLSKDGLFIDTGEPLDPGSVVRFRVILPEDFVFLEGTAVVEWRRSAEVVSDGPPGMALRFVTLSTQNEELVAQLVQDFVDAGGTPFDLDVRPELSDFPTDALEGAPVERDEGVNEAYRLTVRGAGISLEAEALQALADAVPESDEDPDGDAGSDENDGLEVGDSTRDPEAESPEASDPIDEPRGFKVLSGPAESVATEEPEPEKNGLSGQPADAEDVGEPPEIEWSTEIDDAAAKSQQPSAEDAMPEVGKLFAEDAMPKVEESSSEVTDYDSSVTEVLEVPEEFAAGPEVIGEVEEDLGSPAFQVSLPENDDEPDTTPVLPDEGGTDVTVPSDDEIEEDGRSRRLWPLGLAAVLVLAVGAGFLRPHVKTWMETRGTDVPDAAASVSADGSTSGSAAEPTVDETAEIEDGAATGAGEQIEESPLTETVELADDPTPETVQESPPATAVVEPTPASAAATDPVSTADAIASIDVEAGSGGTVVRIRGNGTLEDGAVSMENLSSPPRILIRLRGIRSVYRPFTIESGTAEVTRARIGHHDDRRPPELWVVLDLTGSQVEIGGIDIRGDRMEFVISGD